MLDISAKYMGLELRSPLVVSSNTLSQKLENIVAMEDEGVGAVVLFSLFEEQLKLESDQWHQLYKDGISKIQTPAKNEVRQQKYAVGTKKYLDIIYEAKEKVKIPIIASLNSTTLDGWVEYARDIEFAGADALELNMYMIPTDIHMSALDVEKKYIEILKSIKETVAIPVAVKLNPYFSSIGNMAHQLYEAGADGLVLFNRFYQPDLDIRQLKAVPSLDLSLPSEMRLPLLWISALYGRVPVSLGATTGVHSGNEIVKYLLAGADVAMCASVLYKQGITHLHTMIDELKKYMDDMGFESVEEMKGLLSQAKIKDPTAYQRSNYIQILENKKHE